MPSIRRVSLAAVCVLLVLGTPVFAQSNIGDGDVRVMGVRQVLPDGYRSADIYFGLKNAWNSDMTRLMFWEDDNIKVDGEFGLGMVWARVHDLKTWTTNAGYRAIRKPLNRFPYRYSKYEFEWSPFAGEENIVYALRLQDRTVVRRNVDTGAETVVVSYDPGNGATFKGPILRRWTSDGNLIVILSDSDGNYKHSLEVDVRARSRTLYSVPFAQLPLSVRRRWPAVSSHGHGDFSPDRTKFFSASTKKLSVWDGGVGAALRTFDPKMVYTGFNHVSWESSNQWWMTEDLGKNFITSFYANRPMVDTFGIWQCRVSGTCRLLLEVRSAQDWNNYYVNWPTSPIPQLRKDGRQFVFTSTNGMYSQYDFQQAGVRPWGHRMLYLADLAPAGAPVAPKRVPKAPAQLRVH